MKSRCAERREEAHHTRSGTIYDFAKVLALSVPPAARNSEYAARWTKGGAKFMQAFTDLLVNQEANDPDADFVRTRIRGIVRDARTAEMLSPRDDPIGTKRICVDTDCFADRADLPRRLDPPDRYRHGRRSA